MALHQISELLGGKEVVGANLNDRLDMVELGRRGISKAALANLAGHLSLTWRQIVKLLPVTERTLQRYRTDQPLSLVVSEQILKIAELVARGTDVFGNKEKFLSWLNQPCRSFSDRTPFSLLGSRYGLEMVFDELGRIEYGVYSQMQLFRIAKSAHIEDLSGVGARLYGGRWNHKGVAVLYASESRALAVLECLVHMTLSTSADDLAITMLRVPKNIIPDQVNPHDLPPDWRQYPPPEHLATIGSNWVNAKRSLMLRVPSVIVENEFNMIINPCHPDFRWVEMGHPEQFRFDTRLFRI